MVTIIWTCRHAASSAVTARWASRPRTVSSGRCKTLCELGVCGGRHRTAFPITPPASANHRHPVSCDTPTNGQQAWPHTPPHHLPKTHPHHARQRPPAVSREVGRKVYRAHVADEPRCPALGRPRRATQRPARKTLGLAHPSPTCPLGVTHTHLARGWALSVRGRTCQSLVRGSMIARCRDDRGRRDP
jgi:hypothetical protein